MTSPPASAPHCQVNMQDEIPTLRYSVNDGVAWSVMVGAGESYLGAFGIFLKATPLQVGMLAAIPPLFLAIAQAAGVVLMEFFKRRREIVVSGAFLQASVWIPIILSAFLPFPPLTTVNILIFLASLYFTLGGLGVPAWNSLLGDVVPSEVRGRYFGSRLKKSNLAYFVAMLVAGQVLFLFEKLECAVWGFTLAFATASLARYVSMYWLSRHIDPPCEFAAEHRFSFWQFVRRVRHSNFTTFVFFVGLMNFSVNFAGPYFALYMLRDLKFSYMQFTVAIAAVVASQFLTLQHWGNLSDRFGNKKIINVSSVGVALCAVIWLFSPSVWWIFLVQFYAGFVWAGFNLAIANFLFDAVSPPKRARCVAYQSIINGIFIFLGALAGGLFVSHPPPFLNAIPLFTGDKGVLLCVFLISTILRLIVVAIFLPRFKEVREVQRIGHRQLLFRIISFRPVSGATFAPVPNGAGKGSRGRQS